MNEGTGARLHDKHGGRVGTVNGRRIDDLKEVTHRTSIRIPGKSMSGMVIPSGRNSIQFLHLGGKKSEPLFDVKRLRQSDLYVESRLVMLEYMLLRHRNERILEEEVRRTDQGVTYRSRVMAVEKKPVIYGN